MGEEYSSATNVSLFNLGCSEMEQTPIRILIVDDNVSMRAMIRAYLDECAGIEVVGDTGDPLDVSSLVRETAPDIILLDMFLPHRGGVEVQRIIASEFPAVRVLALSVYTDKRLVKAMIKEGAAGYISKSDMEAELEIALRQVAQGAQYFSEEIRRASQPH